MIYIIYSRLKDAVCADTELIKGLKSSGTYRSMGPLTAPANALSSIVVRYLFL